MQREKACMDWSLGREKEMEWKRSDSHFHFFSGNHCLSDIEHLSLNLVTDLQLIMVDQTQAFILAPFQNPNKMSTNKMPKRCFKRLKPVRWECDRKQQHSVVVEAALVVGSGKGRGALNCSVGEAEHRLVYTTAPDAWGLAVWGSYKCGEVVWDEGKGLAQSMFQKYPLPCPDEALSPEGTVGSLHLDARQWKVAV